MGLGRGALGAALLLPLLLPVASAAVTYNFFTLATEHSVGDTVTFRVHVTTYDETFTVTRAVHLWRETGGSFYGTVGDHGTQTINPGSTNTVQVQWNTNTHPAPTWGRYRAEFDTPHGTLATWFDLGYAPDLEFHNMSIQHPPGVVNWQFLRDGTQKTVYGCLKNTGTEPITSARVQLFYRVHTDPLFFGGLQSPRIPTADYRDGHAVETKLVQLAFPTQKCMVGGLQTGWLVRFDWRPASSLSEGGPLSYEVGLRADPANDVWELEETDNVIQQQSTMQPMVFLP